MYTFKPLENTFRIIAWSGGVPSTTMVAMSLNGDLEPVDAILTADPGWEHRGTYENLDEVSVRIKNAGVHSEVLVTGDIRCQGAEAHIHMPFWTETGAPLRRQCSKAFKADPQKRRARELLGFHESKAPHPPRAAIEQWIGYTMDERRRIRDFGISFMVNRWPLIEKGMYRTDCVQYLEEHGWHVPVPSSCVGCPYKSAARWLATTQDELAQAIEFDERNRNNPLAVRDGSLADSLYIYRYAKPLAEVDFQADIARDPKQMQLSLFDHTTGIEYVGEEEPAQGQLL